MKEHAETSLSPFSWSCRYSRSIQDLTPLPGALLLLHLHCCHCGSVTLSLPPSLPKDIGVKSVCWFSITHHCVFHGRELWGWIWVQTGAAHLHLPSSLFCSLKLKIWTVVLSRCPEKSKNSLSVDSVSPSTFPASSYSKIRDFLSLFSKALFQASP